MALYMSVRDNAQPSPTRRNLLDGGNFMKVVEFTAYGTPSEVTHLVEIDPSGPPADGEVVIHIEAFPINPADLLMIEGRYAVKPPLPARLGAESVARISAVGAGVTGLQVGDRVINMGRENWAQQKKVKAAEVIPVPGAADPLQLAMLKVNPPTALLMLRKYVDLSPGDWVIQNAANSGVGTCLIRLARAAGIKTVNVVRRESLIEPLKAMGADAVVIDGDDLGERVRAETGGAGARLGIDAVGGEAVTRLADCLEDGGTVVNYGLLSGRDCRMTGAQLIFRRHTLTGFWLVPWLQSMAPGEVGALYAELAGRMAEGELNVHVEAVYDMDDIKQALAHAGAEGRDGKVLVTPNGPVG